MRLGQLSRKIKVRSSDIIDFTEKELGVKLDASLNAKIDDHIAKQIIAHYAIGEQNIDPPEEIIQETIEKEVIKIEKTEVVEEDIEESVPSNQDSQIDEPPIEEIDIKTSSEVIKAKAEKLEGLKVIGKIDLPPPPPPEMVEIDGVMYDKEVIKQERREEKEKKRAAAQKRREERQKQAELRKLKEAENNNKVQTDIPNLPKKNESFASLRRKEEKAFQLRKQKEENERRIKQAKHYVEKHKVVSTPKPKKKANKSSEIKEVIVKEEAPKPKTLLGKFWRWMNSY